MSEEMSVNHRQHTETYLYLSISILATKAEFLWNVSRIGNRIGRNYEPCSQNILTKNYGKFLLC